MLVKKKFTVSLPEIQESLVPCKCKRGCKACNKTGRRIKKIKTGKSIITEVERWCHLIPFVPSHDQMLRYCKFFNYPISKHRKTKKDTIDEKALKHLLRETGDPIFDLDLKYQEIQKIDTTYLGTSWSPNPSTKRTVGDFFAARTTSGQLTCRDPNLQTIPRRKDISADFKLTIISPPSAWLCKFDFKSFHACTLAMEAQSSEYLRLARLDIHSFLTSYMMNEPASLDWEDNKLKDHLKYIRAKYPKIRDDNAKQAILGWQLGMEAYTLFMNNREIYESKKETQIVIDHINTLFSDCAKWRKDEIIRAHSQGETVTRYCYRRRWYEVLIPCRTCHYRARAKCPKCKGWGWTYGDEAKEAISFPVQNDAHGHVKDVMLRLARYSWMFSKDCWMINQVHDDLEFEIHHNQVDRLLPIIKAEMEKPNLVLKDPVVCPKGLIFKVEVKIGKNLENMKEVAA